MANVIKLSLSCLVLGNRERGIGEWEDEEWGMGNLKWEMGD